MVVFLNGILFIYLSLQILQLQINYFFINLLLFSRKNLLSILKGVLACLSSVVLPLSRGSNRYKHKLLRNIGALRCLQVFLRLSLGPWKWFISRLWVLNPSKLVDVLHERVEVDSFVLDEPRLVVLHFLAKIEHLKLILCHGIKREVVGIGDLFEVRVVPFFQADDLLHAFGVEFELPILKTLLVYIQTCLLLVF